MENQPISPIQQSVPPVQSYPPQPMPPARSHGPVVAAIVVGILVLAGAAFAYTKLVNKPAETASPTPTASPSSLPTTSASPTPSPMAGWKTYSNTQLGFSAQYPSHVLAQQVNQTNGLYTYDLGFSILIPNSHERWVFLDLIIMTKAQYQHIASQEGPKPNVISSNDAYVAATYSTQECPETKLCNDNALLFTQIPATFQFTQVSEAVLQVGSLKTYQGINNSYSFDYPSNWVVSCNGFLCDISNYAPQGKLQDNPQLCYLDINNVRGGATFQKVNTYKTTANINLCNTTLDKIQVSFRAEPM